MKVADLKDGGIQSVGYLLVMIIAFFTGHASRLALENSDILIDKYNIWRLLYPLLTLCFFAFVLLLVRALVLDPKMQSQPTSTIGSEEEKKVHSKEINLARLFGLLCAFGTGVVFIVTLLPDFAMALHGTLIAGAIFLVWTTVSFVGIDENNPQEHFIRKIFFPAFCMCSGFYMIGWFITGATYKDLIATVIYYISFFSILGISYARKFSNLPKLIFANIVIPFSLFLLYCVNFGENISLNRPEFFLSIFWALTIGVFEVSKQPSIFSRINDTDRLENFRKYYFSGANWSSILFLHAAIFYCFVFKTPALYIYISVCIIASVYWAFLQDKHKKASERKSVYFGYFVSLLLLFSLTVGRSIAPELEGVGGYASFAGNIATILGLIITIFFVLYADRYLEVPSLYKDNELFERRRYLIMTIPIIIVIFTVIVFTIMGICNVFLGFIPSDIMRKTDVVLLFFLVEMAAIFVISLWIRGLDSDDDGPAPKTPLNPPPLNSVRENTEQAGAHKILHSIRSYWRLVRPATSLLAGGLSASAFVSVSGWRSGEVALIILLSTTVCMFGFVVNDLFDYHKDQLGQRSDKPLVSKDLTRRDALIVAVVFSWLSIALSWSFSLPAVLVTISTLLGLIAYSPLARKTPALKGLYTALLTCSPLITGYIAAEGAVPISFLAVLLVFITGREILIDLNDQEADVLASLHTLPRILGVATSWRVAWLMMFAAILVGFLMVNSPMSRALMAVSIASLAIVAVRFRSDYVCAVSWSRLPMALSALAVVWA